MDLTLKIPPDCPYCLKPSVFSYSSAHLYNGQDYGPVYECARCKAWVGCHKKEGFPPLGTPANAEVRELRKKAHSLFDPLWQRKMARDQCSKGEARSAGYRWLSRSLNIPPHACHISWMQTAELLRVIQLCRQHTPKPE